MAYYQDENGGGFFGRLIIAAGIGLVGLFIYMNQVQENPVTHESQHLSMTPSQEIRLGLASAPEMERKMGGEVPASDPRTREVRKIGKYLVQRTEAKDSPWKFHFHLIADNQTINAFALPGGQVFITLGLLNKLQTEAQLAGVLGHEMGHVIERHAAQQMAKSQFGQTLVLAVAAGGDHHHLRESSPMVIASVVNHMFQLHFSRKDESQADQWGVRLMSEVGYDPQAMVQVLEILKAESKERSIEMFQTHPDPDRRIRDIKEYLKKHPPQGELSNGGNLKEIFSNRSEE